MSESCGSVLAVTSQLPWPLDRGGHIRSYYMLRALANRFTVRLVTSVTEPQATGVRALDSAGIRVCEVRLPSRRHAKEALRATRAALAGEPYVFYRRHDWPQVRRAVEAELARDHPDILYCDHLDSWLFAERSNGRKVVVDMHNVYSNLVQRTALEQRSRIKQLYLRREAALLERLERDVVRIADLVFAVSDIDASHLAPGGSPRLHVVPNGVDCDSYATLATGRADAPPLILFLGTLSWPPNVAAAAFLANVVLPRVAEALPHARLRIVGRDPSAEVLALRRDRVDVIGSVPDVRPHLADARLLAVPLEAGGGTRLKILEAFAAGLPVVSTPVGCEGLRVMHNEHLLVASRDSFDAAILELLANRTSSMQLASNARRLVREQYDWRSITSGACDWIAAEVSG